MNIGVDKRNNYQRQTTSSTHMLVRASIINVQG